MRLDANPYAESQGLGSPLMRPPYVDGKPSAASHDRSHAFQYDLSDAYRGSCRRRLLCACKMRLRFPDRSARRRPDGSKTKSRG